jgi:hypothetical protein
MAGAAITAAAIVAIKLSRIPVLLVPISAPRRVAGGPMSSSRRSLAMRFAQRFFECTTAMSAVLPVPWQTRHVSLTPTAALRGA